MQLGLRIEHIPVESQIIVHWRIPEIHRAKQDINFGGILINVKKTGS